MKYSVEFREKVCKEYLTTDIGRIEICEKYNLPLNTIKCWLFRYYPNEYRQDKKARTYNIEKNIVSNSEFKDLSKEELQRLVIKKEFEIKRLKKKYPWLDDTESTDKNGLCK